MPEEKRQTTHPIRRERRVDALRQRQDELRRHKEGIPFDSGYEPKNRDHAIQAATEDIRNLKKKLNMQ